MPGSHLNNRRFRRVAQVSLATLVAFAVFSGDDDDPKTAVRAAGLNVMTFNIRFDKGTDGVNDWNYEPNPRKERVYSVIRDFDPDLLGVSEVFANQEADLRAEFPEYGYVGQLTPNGAIPGEESGIFYRLDRFDLLEQGTFWHSSTPEVPGTYFPDAEPPSSIRNTSWVKLFDNEISQAYYVISTHWYSQGQPSRMNTSNLLRTMFATKFNDLPFIIMGDMNATPNTAEVLNVKGVNDPNGVQLVDAYRVVHPIVLPNERTSNSGWGGNFVGERTDQLFHAGGIFKPTSAEIVRDMVNGGWPSDHYPVTVQYSLTPIVPILPVAETTPSPDGHDSVDDPAIWIDRNNPSNSFIIAADKALNGASGGRLELYNIIDESGTPTGNRFGTVGTGEFNNVDLRYGFQLGGQPVDLAVASNRTTDGLSVFRVDGENRTLVDVTGATALGFEPYGLTMYQATDGKTYALASDRNADRVRQYELVDNGAGLVNSVLRRTITTNGLTEGMVVDDEYGFIYIAEEDNGIYRFPADPATGNLSTNTATIVDLVSDVIVGNLEGMALYDDGHGGGYLIVSLQGIDAFAVYDRQTNDFLGRFSIANNDVAGVDGTSATDGIDVTSAALGDVFYKGFLIAMDDDNPGGVQDNFKLVPFDSIDAIFRQSPRIAGDVDDDGNVNRADLALMALRYGTSHRSADFDEDNLVGLTNLAAVRANWTGSVGNPSPAAVPEPNSLALAVLVAAIATAWRRRG